MMTNLSQCSHKQVMAIDFTAYDNTQDARFESMRNYPKRVQLYRKHKDLMKDYEQKVQYYKRYQKMFSIETKLKMQKLEGRFSRLLSRTIAENPTHANNLKYECFSRGLQTRESERDLIENLKAKASTSALPENHALITESASRFASPVRPRQRLPSRRSVSVDHFPGRAGDEQLLFRASRAGDRTVYVRNSAGPGNSYPRSFSSLSINNQRKVTPVLPNINKK